MFSFTGSFTTGGVTGSLAGVAGFSATGVFSVSTGFLTTGAFFLVSTGFLTTGAFSVTTGFLYSCTFFVTIDFWLLVFLS